MKKQTNTALVAIFILFFVLFHYPIIAIFNIPETVWAIPLLAMALFAIWVSMVVVMYIVLEKRKKKP